MKIIRKIKDKNGERYKLCGITFFEHKRRGDVTRTYLLGIRIKKVKLKKAKYDEEYWGRWSRDSKLRIAELKVLSLANWYKEVRPEQKYILCFDSLYDKYAEAIDAYTLFLYLQEKGIPSKYAILRSNPLFAKLRDEGKLKDILPVNSEAELIIYFPDIIAQSRFVYCSFGFYVSNIFKQLPFLKLIFIEHGVTLLKKWCAFLYLEGGKCECDLMLASTRATKNFYDKNNLWQDKMVCCGMPRWDNLKPHNGENKVKKIFIFFTWRASFMKGLSMLPQYVNRVQKIISSINEIIGKREDIKIYLGLHHALQYNYNHYNFNQFKHVNIVPTNEISTLIQQADLYITDYSSVAFDLMYRDVPTIFYRFDTDVAYPDKRDIESVTSASEEDERLYNCCYNLEDAIQKVRHYIDNGFVLEEENKRKNDEIFWPRGNNCEQLLKLTQEWSMQHP